jgi:hypothetical protein
LIEHEISEEDFISSIKKSTQVSNFCKQFLIPQAKKRFLKRKDQLDLVCYSMIRVKSRSTANELYLRISENESTFEEIASDYSEGPEKNTKGNIGPYDDKSDQVKTINGELGVLRAGFYKVNLKYAEKKAKIDVLKFELESANLKDAVEANKIRKNYKEKSKSFNEIKVEKEEFEIKIAGLESQTLLFQLLFH